MTITQMELDNFHRFASQRIGTAEPDVDLDVLLTEWESQRHRAEINAAIREGLDDIEAGRTRPAEEVTRELQGKHGIP